MDNGSFLLRFLEEKEFVDMFMNGKIRLNSLNFFWGEHDEPTKAGQIDKYEGLVCSIFSKDIDSCHRAEGYKYCNLLCCFNLTYQFINGKPVWNIDEDMYKFGDYVVVIKDRNSFVNRLVKAAEREGYKIGCKNVSYGHDISPERDVFNKETEYSYQNEWRAALYREAADCEAMILDIGPIDDIAEWCYAFELPLYLKALNIVEDDFAGEDYSGNISRKDLAELFIYSGENREFVME